MGFYEYEGEGHPAAKGVLQKEFGKKVTKKVTEASEKVTKKWPKGSRKRKKWSNSFCRTPSAAPWDGVNEVFSVPIFLEYRVAKYLESQ